MKKIFLYILLFFNLAIFAQVELNVDTNKIRIGEQIQYELSVVEQDYVVFPKLVLDSLGKIEIIHETPVDTLNKRLYKNYYLTGFDSGAFQIPAQRINIGNIQLLSDSLLIEVNTVAVDTTKQGLFPIKQIYKATPKKWTEGLENYWWVLPVLLFLGFLYWLFFYYFKKEKKKNKKIVSPLEAALNDFTLLDKKDLVTQEKIKEYYIELSEIVRSYIGKDVAIPTLEVTTDELISLLEIHNKSKKIGIEKERIKILHNFLRNADLVKFAKAKPEEEQIQEDRTTAENLINEIHRVVYKPVFDEFGNEIIQISEEEKQAILKRKRRNKTLLYTGAASLLLVFSLVFYYGFQNVKDTLLGHPTKTLLAGDWYTSSYGYPAVSLETPEVLIAQNIPARSNQEINTVFVSKEIVNDFNVVVLTSNLDFEDTTEENTILEKEKENFIAGLENNETLQDLKYEIEEVTNNGIDGIKLKAQFLIDGKAMHLDHFIFVNKHAVQKISIQRRTDDIYADKIAKRISESIEIHEIVEDDE